MIHTSSDIVIVFCLNCFILGACLIPSFINENSFLHAEHLHFFMVQIPDFMPDILELKIFCNEFDHMFLAGMVHSGYAPL